MYNLLLYTSSPQHITGKYASYSVTCLQSTVRGLKGNQYQDYFSYCSQADQVELNYLHFYTLQY